MEFRDIKNFIEGNYNHLKDRFNLLPDDLKELSDKRIKICLKCPELKDNACSKCGCGFPEMTMTEDTPKGKHCPIGKW